jgi:hypothetical protein
MAQHVQFPAAALSGGTVDCMAEHMTLEQIKAAPDGSFPRRALEAGQLRALRQIRAGEGQQAFVEALAAVAERDGQDVAERLRAALAESDRRAS